MPNYFSHDSNAREDPKILQMRSVYGYEGYGWYWALIEVMREQEEYKLSMQGQYAWNAYALLLQCDADAAQKYINDCINEFGLFESDGEYFWSASLKRRMAKMEEKSEKARQAALSRWQKDADADAMQTHSERNANKIKENKINIKDPPPTPPGESCAQPSQKTIYPEEFESFFWQLYPLKIEKKKALKVWEKRKKEGWTAEKINTATKNYLLFAKQNGYKYKHPTTFLNSDLDEWFNCLTDARNRSPTCTANPMKFEPWQLEMLEKKRRKQHESGEPRAGT